MLLNELLNGPAELFTKDSRNPDISCIEYDSRKVRPGCLFVALKGVAADGHKYIEKAVGSGAVAVLGQREIKDIQGLGDCVYIRSENSRKALAAISHNWYGRPADKLKMIGVTGTNGKTTITFIIRDILEALGRRVGIIGTTGIFVGNRKLEATHTTPESLELAGHLAEMHEAGMEYVVMEVSSHALVQHRADYISFDAAVFTNLTHEHLDYHKTMEEYAAAKRLLFEKLKPGGFAIVNADDPYSEKMLEGLNGIKAMKCGRHDSADIQISQEKFSVADSSALISYLGKEYLLSTKLMGRFNIDNLAQASAVAIGVGIEAARAIDTGSKSTGAPGRMQRIMTSTGAIGIVDYAHTPDALEKALNACRELLLGSAGKLICVFGCGGDRDRTKRPIMGDLGARLADTAIVTDDNPRTENPDSIIQEILAGIDEQYSDKLIVSQGRDTAIKYAVSISATGDIILVAGKGHETYQILGRKKIHFDDSEYLAQAQR